jgi:predicted dehydrogenase
MTAPASHDGPGVRAALIGLGFIGGLHLDALRRIGVPVAGVLTSDPDRAAAKAARLGVARIYRDLAELCADRSVDVVHVTSPNYLHASQVLALLDAGKHVVCEKPLAVTTADGTRMVAAAAARGLVNAVCFNIRFYPLVQQARQLVSGGAIGAPRLVTGGYLQDWLLLDTDWNWRLVPQEAGPLRSVADIGMHWLDLVQFIVGSKVVEVFADLHTFVPVRRRPSGPVETFTGHNLDRADREEVAMSSDDAATILVRFANGAAGSVVVSQVSPGRKNSLRFEVAGAAAGLAWDSEDPERLWIGHRERANEVLMRDPALLDDDPRRTTHYPGGHAEGFAETFLGLFESVYSAAAAGTQPDPAAFPTFADGLAGLRIGDAVLRSHAEGRWAPVEEDP